MDFVVYKPEQLERNSFGLLEPQGDFTILEPSQIDLIHVPGFGFHFWLSGWFMEVQPQPTGRYLGISRRLTTEYTLYPCQIGTSV